MGSTSPPRRRRPTHRTELISAEPVPRAPRCGRRSHLAPSSDAPRRNRPPGRSGTTVSAMARSSRWQRALPHPRVALRPTPPVVSRVLPLASLAPTDSRMACFMDPITRQARARCTATRCNGCDRTGWPGTIEPATPAAIVSGGTTRSRSFERHIRSRTAKDDVVGSATCGSHDADGMKGSCDGTSIRPRASPSPAPKLEPCETGSRESPPTVPVPHGRVSAHRGSDESMRVSIHCQFYVT